MTFLTLVPFLSAILYWGGVAVNAAVIKKRTGSSPSLKPKRNLDYVLWLAWGLIIGLWAASPWLQGIGPELFQFSSAAIIGLVLVALGFIGTWWCYITLGNAWSISVNKGKTNELITNGPYKLVRHPIYSLQWLIILGCFLILPGIPLLASLVILTVAMHWKAGYEEKALGEVFGDAYAEYRKSSGRFFPGC